MGKQTRVPELCLLFPLVSSNSTTGPDRLVECHQAVHQPVGKDLTVPYSQGEWQRQHSPRVLSHQGREALWSVSLHSDLLGDVQLWLTPPGLPPLCPRVQCAPPPLYPVPSESCRWCWPLPQGWGQSADAISAINTIKDKNVAVGLTKCLVWGSLSVICSAWFHSKSAARKWGTKRKYLATNPSIFFLPSAFLTHLHFIALLRRPEEKKKWLESKAIFDNVNAQPFMLSRIQICNFKMELCQSHFLSG